jgi:hypothetical protein
MKYAVEMSSAAMIYIPSFIKIVSAIQKFMGGGYMDTDRQAAIRASLLSFFQNKESELIKNRCKDTAHTLPYMTDLDYVT